MALSVRNGRSRRTWVAWAPLAAALLLCAGLTALDGHLKASPGEDATLGYCPKDAWCVAQAPDFPEFWKSLAQTDAADIAKQEMPAWFAGLQVAIRQDTGIRPTALRWKTWMGERVCAAAAPQGYGLCVRPGLLIRLVDIMTRIAGNDRDATGAVRTFGELHYAWRQGFLVVSPSPEYVAAALTAPSPVDAIPDLAPQEMAFRYQGAQAAEVRIQAQDGLPVTGWLEAQLTSRTTPFTTAGPWPSTPIASVSASHWSDLVKLADWAAEAVDLTPFTPAARLLAHYLEKPWAFGALPPQWEENLDQLTLTLFAVDTQGALPIPSAALIMQTKGLSGETHPLRPLMPTWAGLESEWNGFPGIIVPWLSDELLICLAGAGHQWYLTTQEPLMARLAGRLDQPHPIQADIAIRIHWDSAADCGRRLLRKAAELELLPKTNPDDIEATLIPALNAVARLGTCSLDATQEATHLRFSGHLAAQELVEQ